MDAGPAAPPVAAARPCEGGGSGCGAGSACVDAVETGESAAGEDDRSSGIFVASLPGAVACGLAADGGGGVSAEVGNVDGAGAGIGNTGVAAGALAWLTPPAPVRCEAAAATGAPPRPPAAGKASDSAASAAPHSSVPCTSPVTNPRIRPLRSLLSPTRRAAPAAAQG